MFNRYNSPLIAQNRSLTVLPTGDRPQDQELIQKLQTGRIQLYDVPVFIGNFIEFGLLLAGVVTFLALIVGGYQYIVGGAVESMRESGKTTLTYAIIGFVLSLLSYGIVNIVQIFATSF